MFILTKIALIVAICGISVSAELSAPRKIDMSLMSFMARSRTFTQENPHRSMACFDYYIPVLNGHTQKYEEDYAKCLRIGDDERKEVDEDTQEDRSKLEKVASESCNALQGCTANPNSINYFDCFAETGAENSKAMYGISADASEILANVREAYRLIETREFKCTNASERAYVENTAATYEELQSCIQGKTPVPTTTVPPVTTTTEEPETTTPAPEEPETSTPAPEEPETSTPAPEEPETSTPAPEEPETSTPAPEESAESTESPESGENSTEESTESPEGSGEESEDKSLPSDEKLPEEDLDRQLMTTIQKLRNRLRQNLRHK